MSSVGSRVSSRINFFNGLGLNSRSREDELPFASRGDIQLSEEGFPVEEDNSQILRSSSQSLGGGILSRRHPPARVNPPNEDNVAPVIVIASYQIEMKRYQAFSVAAFAGVLAISVFALSSVNKLDDFARAWVIACFAVMIFLSAMTISTAFTNDNGSNDNDVADAHAVQVGSLGCSPGATISRVSLSLLVNVLYIVDLSLFLMFSYLKGVSTAVPAPASADRDVPKDHQSLLTTLIIVGIAFDIITSLLWINIWRRPESVYSSRVMIFVQKVCWSAVGKMFIFMACASADVGPAAPVPQIEDPDDAPGSQVAPAVP